LVDVAPKDYSNVLLVGWIAQLLFTFTTSLVKISISTFYLRLANTKTYRIIIYCTIGWLIIWCITFVFVVIFVSYQLRILHRQEADLLLLAM